MVEIQEAPTKPRTRSRLSLATLVKTDTPRPSSSSRISIINRNVLTKTKEADDVWNGERYWYDRELDELRDKISSEK